MLVAAGTEVEVRVFRLLLCQSWKVGLNHSLEKGVRYPKCTTPFGPFRFWYLTPFSRPTLKLSSDKTRQVNCRSEKDKQVALKTNASTTVAYVSCWLDDR